MMLRYLSLFLLVAVCSLTIWSVLSTWQRRASVPSRLAWQKAVEQIKTNIKEGDRVTWYPEWAGEARLALHDLPVLPLPFKGSVDLGQARRLWVLGAFGYNGTKLASSQHLQALQKLEVISESSILIPNSGPVSLSLLEVKGEEVLHALYDELDDSNLVRFSRWANEQEQECPLWALNGWHCPASFAQTNSIKKRVQACLDRPREQQLKSRSKRRDLYTLDHRRWLPYIDCKLNPIEHFSRDWRVIDETPRRCLSAIPHQNKQAMLTWFTPNQASAQNLWFSYGWEDLALRHPFRASQAQAITIEIKKGSEILFSKEIKPQLGWFREQLSLPTTSSQDVGPPSPFTIYYWTKTHNHDAHLCISLSVRGTRQ